MSNIDFIATTLEDGNKVRIRVGDIIAFYDGVCTKKGGGAGRPPMVPCIRVLLQNHQALNLLNITIDQMSALMESAYGRKIHFHNFNPRDFEEEDEDDTPGDD